MVSPVGIVLQDWSSDFGLEFWLEGFLRDENLVDLGLVLGWTLIFVYQS